MFYFLIAFIYKDKKYVAFYLFRKMLKEYLSFNTDYILIKIKDDIFNDLIEEANFTRAYKTNPNKIEQIITYNAFKIFSDNILNINKHNYLPDFTETTKKYYDNKNFFVAYIELVAKSFFIKLNDYIKLISNTSRFKLEIFLPDNNPEFDYDDKIKLYAIILQPDYFKMLLLNYFSIITTESKKNIESLKTNESFSTETKENAKQLFLADSVIDKDTFHDLLSKLRKIIYIYYKTYKSVVSKRYENDVTQSEYFKNEDIFNSYFNNKDTYSTAENDHEFFFVWQHSTKKLIELSTSIQDSDKEMYDTISNLYLYNFSKDIYNAMNDQIETQEFIDYWNKYSGKILALYNFFMSDFNQMEKIAILLQEERKINIDDIIYYFMKQKNINMEKNQIENIKAKWINKTNEILLK
jgi:hypothetical protein